jgi:hypothetical protein
VVSGILVRFGHHPRRGVRDTLAICEVSDLRGIELSPLE